MDVIETNVRQALIARKLGPKVARQQAEAMFPREAKTTPATSARPAVPGPRL